MALIEVITINRRMTTHAAATISILIQVCHIWYYNYGKMITKLEKANKIERHASRKNASSKPDHCYLRYIILKLLTWRVDGMVLFVGKKQK